MSQEKTKNPIDVEKAKEVAKSPKGKIGAVISVVVILAVVGTLAFLFNKTDSPDDYEYTSTTTDVTITGLKNKSLESLNIPEEINSVPVTKIEANAFDTCTAISSVKLPNTVKEIGSKAFNGCSGLKDIRLSNSLTTIGAAAFENCTSLTSIVLPQGLAMIGDNAFDGCKSLTSITLPQGLATIGDNDFDGCKSALFFILELDHFLNLPTDCGKSL